MRRREMAMAARMREARHVAISVSCVSMVVPESRNSRVSRMTTAPVAAVADRERTLVVSWMLQDVSRGATRAGRTLRPARRPVRARAQANTSRAPPPVPAIAARPCWGRESAEAPPAIVLDVMTRRRGGTCLKISCLTTAIVAHCKIPCWRESTTCNPGGQRRKLTRFDLARRIFSERGGRRSCSRGQRDTVYVNSVHSEPVASKQGEQRNRRGPRDLRRRGSRHRRPGRWSSWPRPRRTSCTVSEGSRTGEPTTRELPSWSPFRSRRRMQPSS